jgi:short-subunit dehydrogenase
MSRNPRGIRLHSGMAYDLQGKVIVITGASSGIGAATAIACAKAGMDVALGARRLDKLEHVAGEIRSLGRRAIVQTCDVAKDDEVEQLVNATLDTFGKLDVAFANAGYGLFASVLETPDEQIRAMFETNFHGTLRLLRAAARPMIKNGSGHLLICSSAASEISLPMYGIYSATKAAQDSIAGAMRAELSHTNIHVSSVHPIGTSSEFFDVAKDRSRHPKFHLNTPAALTQTPQQVANAIVRCLRRPKPEVWPSPMTRFGVALTTAMPRVAAWIMRRRANSRYSESS